MKENLVIVGLNTNARHVYEFVKHHDLYNIIGFAVNEEYRTTDEFKGLPVYALETIHQKIDKPFKAFVAVMWNRLNADRKKIYNYCKEHGIQMANLISPLASIKSEIAGENIWVHDFVVIQNDTIIESDVFIMAQSLIGANCHVEPHCFFGAKSTIGGGCQIGEQSFVGLNSTIFDCTTIGKKCLVGAGTIVKRNLPDFTRCKTDSYTCEIKQFAEDEIESKLMFKKNVRSLPPLGGGNYILKYSDNWRAA